MIDQPHSQTEKILTDVIDWCHDTKVDADEILYAGFEPAILWFNKHRAVKKLLVLVVVALIAYGVYWHLNLTKRVTVVLDNSYGVITQEFTTRVNRVDKFLEEVDLDYEKGKDHIDKQIYTRIKDGMTINIVKSYDVFLVVDGETYEYNSLGVTTQELMDHYGIQLGPYDTIDTDLNAHLHALQTVTIVRINIEMVTEEIRIPYQTKYVKNTNLAIGNTEIVQAGVDGVKEIDYICVYRNGEEISKTEIENREVQQQQTKIIHCGTKILKGIPKEVEEKALKVIDNVKAYSYNYGSQIRYGVYGMWCSYGTVAVDRKVIPLGSKLYIEGYGYAIANDIGTDIKGNTLDLFMEYRPQCSIWGVKRVKVYILEYGDNTRYWEVDRKSESLKTRDQLRFPQPYKYG